MEETKLEKINKYAMSIGIMTLFGTSGIISSIIAYHKHDVSFLIFAIPFLFASLFCAFMSYWWFDKVKEDL